ICVRLRAWPRCTRFPYTTLFRSRSVENDAEVGQKFATTASQHAGIVIDLDQTLLLHRVNDPDPELSCDVIVTSPRGAQRHIARRSEEHTSELQSRSDLVCRLLLE